MPASMLRTKIERLQNADIFSSYHDDELKIIAEYSEYCNYRKDEAIFKAGNSGDALYIVESGEVIINKKADNGRDIDIARFLSGDCFGELDMLTGSSRNASARTEVETRLLMFPRKGICFKDILAKHPAVSARILHKILVNIAGRIRKANSLIKENSPIIQELKKQVYSDKLTGLYNRTFLEEKLGEYLVNKKAHVSLLMVKPDNFKFINDTYGHEAGDQALRIMSIELEKIISGQYVAIRFMGNELSVILPGTEREEAYKMAVKIRSSMNRLDLQQVTQGSSFVLTVSIGISLFPEHSATTAELIQKAHELPLMGRARGGNKILFPEDKQGR